MSYTVNSQLGAPIRRFYTGPDGRLVADNRSWFERNQKGIILTGAVVGVFAILGLVLYAEIKTEEKIRKEFGELGVQAYRTMRTVSSTPFWMG